ncbi:MAG: regulatory protein RecX [Clostridia bacterium]|nr:regulatory protein RecX [Clostridia bacterium]
MLITAVEERKKGMSALFIDGEYAVSIDTVTLISSGKKTGSDITDEELYELLEKSKINRAKEKALYLIEYRARTRKEIMDKLIPLYGENAAELAVERLEELGLIDDEAFAREYAQQLLTKKKYSIKRASFEMQKKGIDRDLIDEILEELEPDSVEQIVSLLETKYARYLDDEKGRARAVNGLKSMGYSWYDIKEAMTEFTE